MQQIFRGAQAGACELGRPARPDTLQEPQLTLQRVTCRGPSPCVHHELPSVPLRGAHCTMTAWPTDKRSSMMRYGSGIGWSSSVPAGWSAVRV